MRQRGFIGEAEGSINGIRLRAHFKPLQQGFRLRVVGKYFMPLPQGYGHGGGSQYFHGIAGLQVPLADFCSCRNTGELPQRGGVVDERIIESF